MLLGVLLSILSLSFFFRRELRRIRKQVWCPRELGGFGFAKGIGIGKGMRVWLSMYAD